MQILPFSVPVYASYALLTSRSVHFSPSVNPFSGIPTPCSVDEHATLTHNVDAKICTVSFSAASQLRVLVMNSQGRESINCIAFPWTLALIDLQKITWVIFKFRPWKSYVVWKDCLVLFMCSTPPKTSHRMFTFVQQHEIVDSHVLFFFYNLQIFFYWIAASKQIPF